MGLILFLLLIGSGSVSALDCPKQPTQISRDWESEVNATVGRIGAVKGGELKTKAKVATQDLLGKLPDSARIYLEQMMYSSYCSALRDDNSLKDHEKAKLLKVYNTEIRKTITATKVKLTPKVKKEQEPEKMALTVATNQKNLSYNFSSESESNNDFAFVGTLIGSYTVDELLIELNINKAIFRLRDISKYGTRTLDNFKVALAEYTDTKGSWKIVRRSEKYDINSSLRPNDAKYIENIVFHIPTGGINSLKNRWLVFEIEESIPGRGVGTAYIHIRNGLLAKH